MISVVVIIVVILLVILIVILFVILAVIVIVSLGAQDAVIYVVVYINRVWGVFYFGDTTKYEHRSDTERLAQS